LKSFHLSETFEFQFDINSSTETRDSYYRVIKRRYKDHDLTVDSYDRVIERRDRDEIRFETSTDNSLENVQRTKKRRKKKKKTFFSDRSPIFNSEAELDKHISINNRYNSYLRDIKSIS